MRTLVIETATAACSVAVLDDGDVVASAHDVVGRGHAERLVPMIAALPDGGRADRIVVDCGPGSFTGVRVGIAAARGLGLGWGVAVSGFSSLALLAAAAFAAMPGLDRVAVVLEGGHGEVFVQVFIRSLEPESGLESLSPEAALTVIGTIYAVGSGLRRLYPQMEQASATGLPDAADAHLLPDASIALPPRPIYGRAPDAKPNS